MNDDSLSEPELYQALGALTKDKSRWADSMPILEKLLHDADDRVRMEAPEIFRVLGRRRPEFVRPFLEALRQVSETDENRVVRIHCLGAIKATGKQGPL